MGVGQIAGDAQSRKIILQALRCLRRRRNGRVRHNDREFLAAVPAGDIGRAKRRFHTVGKRLYDSVAGLVPIAIIDRLKVVDVDYHEVQTVRESLRAT